jgi:hypothetical protein
MFEFGLSYAQLLARLVVERWKVVEPGLPFHAMRRNHSTACGFDLSAGDEIRELTEGTSYEKTGCGARGFLLVKRLAKY